jgi:O-acetylhomoserine (thiol)-lyase
MSALFVSFFSLCSAGDHIVSASQIYGSTATLLKHSLKRFNIDCTFVDINDQKAVSGAIQDNTKLVFCESIGNPGLDVSNLPAIAETAHAKGIPLVVDATFATPFLNNPIEHGADVVVHSVTKWIGGHGAAVGGVVIDGGNFDWLKSGRFPTLTEPYEPFHGMNFWEEFGPAALAMRIRCESMRDIGAAMTPHNAFLLLQGLETLSLRMQQHVSNAQAMVTWLQQHDAVKWVNHPDIDANSHTKLLFPKGAGSMLTFGVKGGRDAGAAFIDALQLSSNLANVGDSRTLVLHPGSTTHSRLSEADLVSAGISADLIRVSVGIETLKDIQADFNLGLRAAAKVSANKAEG